MDNIFQSEYFEQESHFYGFHEEFSKDGVNIGWGLVIDEKGWASISPAEIESYYLALRNATGKIATAGLGLGYFTLKAVLKDEVTSIDVYEQNQDVIDCFLERFSDRAGFQKINIIQGDVRKTLIDKEYDFVFVDIYQKYVAPEIFSDIELFQEKNRIKQLYMWTHEYVLKDAWKLGVIEFNDLTAEERWFVEKWVEKYTPHQVFDEDYCRKYLTAIKRI